MVANGRGQGITETHAWLNNIKCNTVNECEAASCSTLYTSVLKACANHVPTKTCTK